MSYSSLSAFCPLSALRIFTRIAQSALPVFLPASPPPLVCLSKPSPEETPVRVETRSDTIYTPLTRIIQRPPAFPFAPPDSLRSIERERPASPGRAKGAAVQQSAAGAPCLSENRYPAPLRGAPLRTNPN